VEAAHADELRQSLSLWQGLHLPLVLSIQRRQGDKSPQPDIAAEPTGLKAAGDPAREGKLAAPKPGRSRSARAGPSPERVVRLTRTASIACSDWRVSRLSKPVGCVPLPIHSSGSSASRWNCQQAARPAQPVERGALSERAEFQLGELGRKVAECQQLLTDGFRSWTRSTAAPHTSRSVCTSKCCAPACGRSARVSGAFRACARPRPRSGKEVRLEILGENTQVDRDILERLESPLGTCCATRSITAANARAAAARRQAPRINHPR